MKYGAGIRAAVVVTVVAIVSTAGLAQAQPVTGATNDHPNPFTTINDHFKLPEGRTWGSTSAVDIDPTARRSGSASGAERTVARNRTSIRFSSSTRTAIC